MNLLKRSLVAGAFTLFLGAAVAASGSLSPFKPKVLAVLVQVDSHGKVRGASPATELPPRLTRLLRATLDQMISAPARDRKGRPTSSQFVINLALQASPRPDGNVDVTFAYVSIVPVPPGTWYWVRTDDRQLALASQSARNRVEYTTDRLAQPGYWNTHVRPSMPFINTMVAPAPAAPPPAQAPARNPGNGQ